MQDILDNITFDKLLSSNIFGSLYRVHSSSSYLTVKVCRVSDISNRELDLLNLIKQEILDAGYSPCFIRCDSWLVHPRLSEIDMLEPTELTMYSRNLEHVYMFMSLADYSLERYPYMMVQYQIKCLTFEILYAIYVAKFLLNLSNFNIREGSILLVDTDVDRIYTVQDERFYIANRYLPMLADFSQEGKNQEDNKEGKVYDDVIQFIRLIAYYINEKADLSSELVNHIGDLVDRCNSVVTTADIPNIFNSIFFDDIREESLVTEGLRREHSLNINPL